MHDGCILGIETSCDETAAAVVRSGERLLSNVVSSQIATHQPYGGVVPELASREHLRAIVPVVRQALAEAGQSYQSIDAIAVTRGPGLAGALLVGISYAKALAYALGKPLITVNHLEGHIHSVLLEEKQKGDFEIEFPVLALVVSGGHTHLFLAERVSAERARQWRANEGRGRSGDALRSPRREDADHGWKYENIGRTRDDAAGEAYDKVAKLLGLSYPGGPIIDALAKHGDPQSVKFGLSQIKHPNRGTPRDKQTEFDFSFSGIKTAVLRYVQTEKMSSSIESRRRAMGKLSRPKAADVLPLCDQKTLGLIASFQRAVVDDLVEKTLRAARAREARTLFVTGGVAANSELREKFEMRGAQEGLPVYFPSRQLSTDNAAMIAAAAYPKFLAQDFAGADFSAEASWAL
ncbi:MAG TPA: tRNA (adenosine(37)-N6)-threonylcarbamoyltransferase complex transferase subunit TsaD [Candidatus Angelobacter sp.]|nr:tRNA (adenosine(37)-N6)-threonylcarbamoyltransferase complex transferase subunit TsaD [Candidatus Angelobacter sp.]